MFESIDVSLVEMRARVLDEGTFRAGVRNETLAWLRSHPRKAEAITELLTPPMSA